MRFGILVLWLALTGCATIDVVRMPDGEIAYQATCYEGKGECLNMAARQCRGRYHVLDHESQTDAYLLASSGGPVAGTQETDRLLFRCGEKAEPAPAAIKTSRLDINELNEQPACGNGNCTLRVDKNGVNYCTCKGRRGRAVLECCGQ